MNGRFQWGGGMREVQFTRQWRGSNAGYSVKLFFYQLICLAIGTRVLFFGKPDIGEMAFGAFWLLVGIGLFLMLMNCIRWLTFHPVVLVFDDTGFGGPRVRPHSRDGRIAWSEVESATLDELRIDGTSEAGAIVVKLKSGRTFALDVFHLNYVPGVVYDEFQAFVKGSGFRLAKLKPKPTPS